MPSALEELKQFALVNAFRGCQLFVGLPTPELELIAALTTSRSLDKGAYLFREGDPSRGFYIVQRGAISVHRVNAVGKEQVIHVFRQGEAFAEASLATESGYPADARAVETSQVLLVEKPGFVALLKRRPDLALRMLAGMALHLRVLVAQIEDLTLKDVETRLANWLLRRCPNPDGTKPVEVKLSNTKRVLASELGTVSETFSRTLAKFREMGLVTVKGCIIKIHSPAKLSAVLRAHLGG